MLWGSSQTKIRFVHLSSANVCIIIASINNGCFSAFIIFQTKALSVLFVHYFFNLNSGTCAEISIKNIFKLRKYVLQCKIMRIHNCLPPNIFEEKKIYNRGKLCFTAKKKKCNKENNNECTTKANKWSRKDSSNNLKSYRWVVGFKSMGIHLGRKNKIWQSIRWIVKIREADCTPATPQIHSMIPPSLFFFNSKFVITASIQSSIRLNDRFLQLYWNFCY